MIRSGLDAAMASTSMLSDSSCNLGISALSTCISSKASLVQVRYPPSTVLPKAFFWMLTGTTPKAMRLSGVAHPTVAMRLGLEGIEVVP